MTEGEEKVETDPPSNDGLRSVLDSKGRRGSLALGGCSAPNTVSAVPVT